MKRLNLSKFALISAFTVSFAVLPVTLSASAQTGSSTAPNTSTGSTTEQTSPSQGYDPNYWGLLGLLGLGGLFGRHKREEPSSYREPADRSVSSR